MTDMKLRATVVRRQDRDGIVVGSWRDSLELNQAEQCVYAFTHLRTTVQYCTVLVYTVQYCTVPIPHTWYTTVAELIFVVLRTHVSNEFDHHHSSASIRSTVLNLQCFL